MGTNHNQGSARIYQFPAGGRAALGVKHRDEYAPITGPASARVHEAACGDGWYHEAAIQEERGRDH
jgi:hypothetical protein